MVVYCVSCIKSMHNGGKKPGYLVDLLFGEETVPGMSDPQRWHAELDASASEHTEDSRSEFTLAPSGNLWAACSTGRSWKGGSLTA